MIRIVTFVVVSGLLAYVSRASLARPASHGFPRYFAWECLVGLVALNFTSLGAWFRDPLSARQLASWLLLVSSLLPVGFGARALLSLGRPAPDVRRDPTLFGLEQTTRLVTTGVYRYIRHPIYASLLLLAWGVMLKRPSAAAIAIAGAASVLLVATAIAEERENADYFGPEYETYCRTTKRFVPFIA